MRRLALLGASSLTLLVVWLSPTTASAAFTQCPAVGVDTSCQFLVNVTDTETTIETDSTQGPYEGIEDALIGIVNNSSHPISSINLSAETELFGFEFDGICNPNEAGPRAPGCVVLAKNSAGEPNAKAGEPCAAFESSCGFPPPAEEPTTVTFPENVFAAGFGASGQPVSGYEGPTSWFTNIGAVGSFPTGKGTINFAPAIPPGGSSYFGLESPPVGGFGVATTLSTTLTGGGQSGPSISVSQGTPVTDTATLGGANAPTATGKVTFAVYSDAACTKLVTAAGEAKLASGTAGPSSAVSNLAPGTYYWQAHYAGNTENQAVSSPCGSEVLTVKVPTTTTTRQSAAGASAASLTVPTGTAVTDSARISGTQAANATGTVTYALFKDSKCTVPATVPSTGTVVKGVAKASAPVKPRVGKYYWVATYSGDPVNGASASKCGSEVLTVAKKANLGLPSSKKCFSKRRFAAHPRAPHGVKLVSVEIFINGKHKASGRLSARRTTIDLRGLPKGTFHVTMVATASNGKKYADQRTYHTCVRGKHKKLKK